MNITFMICNEKAEVIWNAIRQANIMLDEMHDVNIFLNSKSVNYEEFDSEIFNINELLKIFTLSEGNLYAWGKLLDLHGVKDGYHKRASQKDLYNLIMQSDKFISFWEN